MIKSSLILKGALVYIAKNTSNSDYKAIFLSEFEFTALEDLNRIFEIFVKPSIKLQAEFSTTSNRGILYIYSIYNKLEKLILIFKEKIRENEYFVSFFLFLL